MTDHANELRRHARKIPHPQGETPGVMLRAADEIERLATKLKAAEKERDSTMRLADSLALALNTSNHERDNLRAKIERMEKQEPVAWMHETRRDSDVVTDAVKHVWGKVAVGSMAAYSIPLYTLPGAKTQGEEK